MFEVSEKTTISTFDKVTYVVPELPSECETIIAKDCSRSNLFTILMKQKWDTKTLTILLPDTEIKIEPRSRYTSEVHTASSDLKLHNNIMDKNCSMLILVLSISVVSQQQYFTVTKFMFIINWSDDLILN